MATQVATQQTATESSHTRQTNSERLVAIETLLPTLATKTDVEKLKSDLTWRIVIAMSIMTAIFVAVLELRAP